jgi:tripartite-type tricarboxylate transporter receptor subunit TctC
MQKVGLEFLHPPKGGGTVTKYKNYTLAALLLAGSTGMPEATAQTYPARPVRMIVPFAPGGGADIFARHSAARLTERLGQQFVVDNRGGSGGLIGMELTAAATPDGYTILFSSASYAAVMAMKKSSYALLIGLTPVSPVAAGPYAVAVHPSLPTTLQGFLDLARNKPGTMGYATPGVGGLTHLATELLLSMAKVRITHVPYKGAGAALPDVIANRTQLIVTPPAPLIPHFQAGRLRPLGVTSATRMAELPAVPVVQDTIPGYVVTTWYGLFAPNGTPRATIITLNAAMNRALEDRELRKSFESQGVDAVSGSPESLGKTVRDDYQRWAKVVKDNNIAAD